MSAPNVSEFDAELSEAVAGMYRLMWPQFSGSPQLGKAAKLSGLSTAQVRAYLDGEFMPPPGQRVALVKALVGQAAASRASLMQTIRTTAPPVPAESSREGAEAEAKAIAAEFVGWRIETDGLESLDGEKPKLVWRAHRSDKEWPDVHAATAAELRGKLTQVTAHLDREARVRKAYHNGGVTRDLRSLR